MKWRMTLRWMVEHHPWVSRGFLISISAGWALAGKMVQSIVLSGQILVNQCFLVSCLATSPFWGHALKGLSMLVGRLSAGRYCFQLPMSNTFQLSLAHCSGFVDSALAFGFAVWSLALITNPIFTFDSSAVSISNIVLFNYNCQF